MNDLTTGGGISEALKRRYGISDERPVATLATDLFPMINAADGAIPDLAILQGVRLCSGYAASGPVAAKYSGIVLRNPAGSGVIATVTTIQVATTTGSLVYFSHLDPGTVGTAQITRGIVDTRVGESTAVRIPPALEFRIQDTATPDGFGIWSAATTVPMRSRYILTPGSSLGVFDPSLNTAFQGGMVWQERQLQAWEDFREF